MTRRKDPAPYYGVPPDRGCRLAASCLACPLPCCWYEVDRALQRKVLNRLWAEQRAERAAAVTSAR